MVRGRALRGQGSHQVPPGLGNLRELGGEAKLPAGVRSSGTGRWGQGIQIPFAGKDSIGDMGYRGLGIGCRGEREGKGGRSITPIEEQPQARTVPSCENGIFSFET